MQNYTFPIPTTVVLFAVLTEKYKSEKLGVILPATDNLSVRVHIVDSDNIQEIKGPALILLNGVEKIFPIYYLEVILKNGPNRKSMRLLSDKAIIVGCNSTEEAFEMLKEINNILRKLSSEIRFEFKEINEAVVFHRHDIIVKEDIAKIIKHFSECGNFTVKHTETSHLIRYQNSNFTILKDRISQRSICKNDAVKAFNAFIKELNKIN